MQNAKDLFTPAEKEKINHAVASAEKLTSGEIVPVVAAASGRYDRAEDMGGFLLALAALAVSWMLAQRIEPVAGEWAQGQRLTLTLPWILLILVAGFIAGVAIASRVGWLRRLLTPKREMLEEVERAARHAFASFRVRRTAARTGILIYVSLFEHMVYVLGDDAIAARLQQKDWDEVRDLILNGLRSGHAADAMCDAIARCGELLGRHFPYRAGDVNEIGDELR
ncbi:MAG: TPM domain-containing protein, partial [Terriglobales bacterium]